MTNELTALVLFTMKITVVAPIQYGLEDQSFLPLQMSLFHRCPCFTDAQCSYHCSFEGAQFPTVSFRP